MAAIWTLSSHARLYSSHMRMIRSNVLQNHRALWSIHFRNTDKFMGRIAVARKYIPTSVRCHAPPVGNCGGRSGRRGEGTIEMFHFQAQAAAAAAAAKKEPKKTATISVLKEST